MSILTRRLAPNFTLGELIASQKARELGDANLPDLEQLLNLVELARFLQAVRDYVGGPIKIHSAFRNLRVNAAVGGVPGSDHTLGYAGDGERPGWTLMKLAREIVKGRAEGKIPQWDQLILEPGRCVHLSCAPRLRGEVKTQFRVGGPVYWGLLDAEPRR